MVICFNPRTREGATYADKYEDGSYMVSIHAPVRVRLFRAGIRPETISFNPRTREGATWRALARAIEEKVSIHAPVRVRPENNNTLTFNY